MQILLPSKLAKIVEQNIASGAYSSPEAVIAAALVLLNEAGLEEAEAEADNQRRWQNFQESGRAISHDVVKDWVNSLSTDSPQPCPK